MKVPGGWAALATGIVVVGLTWGSVISTLVVPRGVSSRLAIATSRATRAVFHLVADRFTAWERRDHILAFIGPSILLVLLAAWLGVFLVGFALIFWPLSGGTFGEALRLSGSSMFTLGTVAASGGVPTALVFVAAGTGLVVVALQIAYLPVLYSAFSRRETLVTLLESRGGAPAWGPEILARHVLVDTVDNLPVLYAEWERWAADVAESHTSYPPLIYFRSPHPLRSWVLALLAVLDAAALHHSLMPESAPSATRQVLRMGYVALREVGSVIRIAWRPDPRPTDPIQLTEGEFRDAVRHLVEAGWRPERDTALAWQHFRGWRVNYEALAYAVADRVEAAPAPWSGTRRHLEGIVIPPARPAHRSPDILTKLSAAPPTVAITERDKGSNQ